MDAQDVLCVETPPRHRYRRAGTDSATRFLDYAGLQRLAIHLVPRAQRSTPWSMQHVMTKC